MTSEKGGFGEKVAMGEGELEKVGGCFQGT